ncbi:MAG: acylphosphatase [Lentisphaerae bacterium]|nr:acylphosphatase [Lentisphaerota bacterium]
MPERTRGHFLIEGRVQGVCFRMAARDEAVRLGLTGWVRNRADGRVESVAEGAAGNVAAFRDWCRRGPPAARVRRVAEDYATPRGDAADFRIVT